MAPWRLKSPASRLFTQPFVQAQIKGNVTISCHCQLWGIYRGPVNSPHKRPVMRKMSPFGDVIMRLPWNAWHWFLQAPPANHILYIVFEIQDWTFIYPWQSKNFVCAHRKLNTELILIFVIYFAARLCRLFHEQSVSIGENIKTTKIRRDT